MSDKIPRLKNPAAYEAEDYFHLQRTGQRPENPEWVTRRAAVVADEGLEDDTEVVTDINQTATEQLLASSRAEKVTPDDPDTRRPRREVLAP